MWEYHKTGIDGSPCELFGINIFDTEWESTGEKAEVTDPAYGQKYVFSVYRVRIGEGFRIFAAGEFSNMVYGFYLKKTEG